MKIIFTLFIERMLKNKQALVFRVKLRSEITNFNTDFK